MAPMLTDQPSRRDASDPDLLFDMLTDGGDTHRGCRRDLVAIGEATGRGWSVIPLRVADKRPAIPWQEYQQRRATADELARWFDRDTRVNWGIVCGAISGIYVIDADSPAAVSWCREYLPEPILRVATSKGMHLYFESPASGRAPRNRCRITYQGQVLDIDIRGEGGFVVGPWSLHPSGHVYTPLVERGWGTR